VRNVEVEKTMTLIRSATIAALLLFFATFSNLPPANAQTLNFKSNCPMMGGKSGLVTFTYDIVISHPRTCFWESKDAGGLSMEANSNPACGTVSTPGGANVIGWEYQTRRRGCIDRFSIKINRPDGAIVTVNFTVTVK
jgi:hypothetical protein